MDPSKDYLQPVAKLPKLKFNKRLQVILICLFVSIVFWFLIAMSKTYTDRFIFPVKYINFPGQRIVVNDLPKTIALSVKTTGFKILSYRFSKEQEPVIIDVAAALRGNLNPINDVLAVPSKSFTDDFTRQLGIDYTITGFAPDSILFSFSNKISKRVPVILQSQIVMEKQYDSTGHSLIQPDSVTVSGPAASIANVDYIKTSLLQMSNVKASITSKLDLMKEHLVTTDANQVTVTIPVEKFTEGTCEVPVHSINVQRGYILKTFPDKVKVQYRVSLSKYNEVRPEMFDAVVDASGLPDDKTKQLKVRLETTPYFVRSVTIEPARTDYIMRK
ncbi:MAG: CdaR family protein [Bacteroidota bacterium]